MPQNEPWQGPLPMRERSEIVVRYADHDVAHQRVGAGAAVVAELLERVDQVIDPLLRQPRHLLLSGEARQVA